MEYLIGILILLGAVIYFGRYRIADKVGERLDSRAARKYHDGQGSLLVRTKGISREHNTVTTEHENLAKSWDHGHHIEGHWEPQVERAAKRAKKATRREQRSNPATLLGAMRHRRATKARATVNALSSNRDRELRQHGMVVKGLKDGRPLQGSPGINMGTGDNRHGIGREGHGTRSMPSAGKPFRISKKGQVTAVSSNNKMADMLRRKKK